MDKDHNTAKHEDGDGFGFIFDEEDFPLAPEDLASPYDDYDAGLDACCPELSEEALEKMQSMLQGAPAQSANILEEDPDVLVGFILTREGRTWSNEGLAAATRMVCRAYPWKVKDMKPGSGVLWQMGIELNDPAYLAKLLRVRPDAHIVLSLPEKSVLLPNPDGKLGELTANLLEAAAETGSTSWALLVNIYNEIDDSGIQREKTC